MSSPSSKMLEMGGAAPPAAGNAVLLIGAQGLRSSPHADVLSAAGFEPIPVSDPVEALDHPAAHQLACIVLGSDLSYPASRAALEILKAQPLTANLLLLRLIRSAGAGAPETDGVETAADLLLVEPAPPHVLVKAVRTLVRLHAARAGAGVSDGPLFHPALRVTERLYRGIGESIDYGIWVCDADGRNIYASDTFLKLVGLTQQQCSEFGWGDVLHPDDAEDTIAAWKECVRTGSHWEREHRFKGVDGRWHYVLARGVPIRDDRGQIVCWAGINLDIDDFKRAELALRESEARFRNMADSAPVMIWITEPDGYCTYLNRQWYDFTGQTREQSEGFGWFDAIHPEDRPFAAQAFHSANLHRSVFRMSYRLRRHDGEYRWCLDSASPRLDEKGEFLGFIGSVLDVTELKQAEQALRASQERFETFMANTPAAAWILDQDARFVFVNPTYVRMFNIRQDMVGTYVHDWFPKHLIDIYLENNRAVLRSGRPIECIEPGNRPDGSESVYLVYKFPIRSASGEIMIGGVAADITDRIRAEEALRRSEAEFRAIFELAGNGKAQVDARTGRFIRVNRKFCELTGYSEAELLGMTFVDLTHPEDRSADIERRNAALEGRIDGWTSQKRYVRKDGRIVWVLVTGTALRDDQGRPTSTIASINDITDRYLAEQALRERESRLRLIMDAAPVLISYIDTECRYRMVNQAYERWFGIRSDQVRGRHVREVLGEATWEMVEPYMSRALAGETVTYERELPYKGSGPRWVHVSYTPDFDDAGNVRGFVVVVNDLTEVRRAAEHREQLQQQLAQAQRLESVGLLAGGIAHNFNNLLAVILGNASFVQMDSSVSLQTRRCLDDIISAGERGAALAHELLGYARGRPQQLRSTNLNEQIHRVLKLLDQMHPRSVKLARSLDPDLPAIHADASQVDQVLMNICLNAIQACQEPSEIHIRTRVELLEPDHPAVTQISPGRYVCLEIQDQGIGMDPETLSKVFDPFFTTRQLGQGIGMYSVLSIVKAHGAHIHIDSACGIGTTVRIWWRIAAPEMWHSS